MMPSSSGTLSVLYDTYNNEETDIEWVLQPSCSSPTSSELTFLRRNLLLFPGISTPSVTLGPSPRRTASFQKLKTSANPDRWLQSLPYRWRILPP